MSDVPWMQVSAAPENQKITTDVVYSYRVAVTWCRPYCPMGNHVVERLTSTNGWWAMGRQYFWGLPGSEGESPKWNIHNPCWWKGCLIKKAFTIITPIPTYISTNGCPSESATDGFQWQPERLLVSHVVMTTPESSFPNNAFCLRVWKLSWIAASNAMFKDVRRFGESSTKNDEKQQQKSCWGHQQITKHVEFISNKTKDVD